MQTSRKVLLSLICFASFIAAVSAVLIIPYQKSEVFYYEDINLRNELAGTVDFVVTGASHALSGFVPEVLDDELGCNSYNISGSMMTISGKTFLLERELKRNPIHTVVLELSYDTLTRKEDKEFAIGDEPTLARIETLSDKLYYLTHFVSFNDWLNIYSRAMINGLVYWQKRLLGWNMNNVIYSDKGYHAKDTVNLTMNTIQIQSVYNTEKIGQAYTTENLSKFEALLNVCKENGVRIIIAVVPISDGLVWKIKNWKLFTDWITNYCSKNGYEYYDFNLLKDRNLFWSDEFSFNNADHLSDTGARTFTSEFCKVLQMADSGENVSDLFYTTYDEAKEHFEYHDHLK